MRIQLEEEHDGCGAVGEQAPRYGALETCEAGDQLGGAMTESKHKTVKRKLTGLIKQMSKQP